MAKYGTFKYGTGVKYGGITSPSVLAQTLPFHVNNQDAHLSVQATRIKLTIKHTTSVKWAVDRIRVFFSRKRHLVPPWFIPINRRLKRTKVTLRHTTSQRWTVTTIRLRQRLLDKQTIGQR